MTLKTIASLGSNKYKRVGFTETKKILKEIDNYAIRSKLTTGAKRAFGTSKFSIGKVAKDIASANGAVVASKFIDAVIKHAKKDRAGMVSSVKNGKPAVKKYLRALDNDFHDEHGRPKIGVLGSTTNRSIGVTNAKASISASSGLGVGKNVESSGMESLGIKKNVVSFAGNYKPGKTPSSAAPKAPASDYHPPMKLAA